MLEIVADSLGPGKTKIFLDGQNVAGMLRGYKLDESVNECALATLELIPSDGLRVLLPTDCVSLCVPKDLELHISDGPTPGTKIYEARHPSITKKIGTIKVPMSQVVGRLEANITVTGYEKARIRLVIASWLFQLGGLIAGFQSCSIKETEIK